MGQAQGVRLLVEVKNEMASPRSGAFVEIDGRRAGVSDELGRAYAVVAPGPHRILAYIPGFQYGKAQVTVPAGSPNAGVEVLLDKPDVELVASAAQHESVLPENPGPFSIELRDREGRRVRIEDVQDFTLSSIEGEKLADLARFFVIDRGRLRMHGEASGALRSLLAKSRDYVRFRLRARVRNFEKRTLEVERDYLVGRYRMQGRLTMWGASRGLTRVTLRVRVHPVRWVPGVRVQYYVTTLAGGAFQLANLPFGRVEIESESHAADPAYHWSWWIDSFGDTTVELRPESLRELRQGELPVRYLERRDDERFIVLQKHLISS